MLEEKFIRYITFEKRYSKHTIIAYQADLAQFYQYINIQFGSVDNKDITHFYVRSWIVTLMDSGMDARSVNRKITSLKSYFKFLSKNNLIEHNPMLKIQGPKTSKKLPVFVEKSKMNLLLDQAMPQKGFKAKRDMCIIELFYHAGIRLAELVELQTINVNLRSQQIKVLGKRNKERIIPITNNVVKKLEAYMEEKKPDTNQSCFFVNEDDTPINRKYVYRMVKNNLGDVTTQKKRSPHVLRHTFATHMLDNGADINALKEILGHSSLAATQVYTHNTIEKLKNIHARAHPRGNG